MIVAIDGPAGVGKSTVAQFVADRFDFFNLNSGNFYRAVALSALDKGISPEQQDELAELAASLDLEIKDSHLHLDGKDVEHELRTDRIEGIVSLVSSCVPVRRIVNEHIRRITSGMNVVAEGRDMTSVVFPHGEVKFFLDASPLSRAQRRFKQGTSELTLDEIAHNIEERDRIDRNKKEGSLKITEEAEYLDTSDLTLDQVCEKVSGKIKEYIVFPGE
jgi:cytidylate kinase